MKRPPLPPRRKPLARSTKPIPRTSMKRPARKSPMPTRSSRSRTSPTADRKAGIRAEVYQRDGGCRLAGVPGAGKCHGPLTPHHRRKGGQGGGYTAENLCSLCSWHNDELEADADLALLARTMGLVLKRGDEWGPVQERFWAKVDRAGPVPEYRPDLGPCWIWTGLVNPRTGYGQFFPVRTRAINAHRFAFGCVEALVPGLEIDHLCRVRLCQNPRHLEQVTGAENRRRQAEAQPRPTVCAKGHPIDGTQSGSRIDGTPIGLCRTCRRQTQRDYLDRQRQKEGPADEAAGATRAGKRTRPAASASAASRRSDRADTSQRVAGRS